MRIHVRQVKKVKARETVVDRYSMDHEKTDTVTRDPKIEGTTQVKQAQEEVIPENTDDNFVSERRQETTLLFQKDKVLRPRRKNVNYKV